MTDLFKSSIQMANSRNYSNWCFSLFSKYICGHILEVGCGVGTYTARIIEYGRYDSLLSIDASSEAATYCKLRFPGSRVNVQKADVMDIQGSFNLVICMNVLEHIENDLDALVHMINLLALDGTLFLLVPAHKWLYCAFDRAAGHFRRYNKRDMIQLFSLSQKSNKGYWRIDQQYFNMLGALGYGLLYGLVNKVPQSDAAFEIGLFDNIVVPFARRFEGSWSPFGISLVSIIKREG